MWDLMGLPLPCMVRRFSGVTQGFCTIHSSFGGLNDNFVVSGSEGTMCYLISMSCVCCVFKSLRMILHMYVRIDESFKCSDSFFR